MTDLRKYRNLGKISLDEIRRKLKEHGFYLKDDYPSLVIDPDQPVTLGSSIKIFNFSTRVQNVLDSAEIKTIGQLVEKTVNEMQKYRNFGKICLQEIREKLEDHGFYLKGDRPLDAGMLTPESEAPISFKLKSVEQYDGSPRRITPRSLGILVL